MNDDSGIKIDYHQCVSSFVYGSLDHRCPLEKKAQEIEARYKLNRFKQNQKKKLDSS